MAIDHSMLDYLKKRETEKASVEEQKKDLLK
jgi:hypothetical protein